MTFKLTFLPVGNADSIVMQTDNSTVIVDLGNLHVLEDWLEYSQLNSIERIYVTHDHKDHFPCLIKLVEFLSGWFEHGVIGKIYLPYEFYKIAKTKVVVNRGNSKSQRLLELALIRIQEWDIIYPGLIVPIARGSEEYVEGFLSIQALHPSCIYIENYLAQGGKKLNEISLVLKIDYGTFSALLLADIEGDGLKSLLDFLQKNAQRNDFNTNIVKIPHHGAWPSNGDDLRTLLKFINPEIAVLSVGSKNQHKHVKPELFKTLLDMKNDASLQFNNFLCTEVTRTCVHSAVQIASMGKKGLPKQQLCAGEITIIADASGKWDCQTETEHSTIVESLPYAACTRHAD